MNLEAYHATGHWSDMSPLSIDWHPRDLKSKSTLKVDIEIKFDIRGQNRD